MKNLKKLVIAYSGGLDTSYCASQKHIQSFGGDGSFSKVSNPANDNLLESRASTSATSLTTPPRAALTRAAPSFIRSNSGLPITKSF